MMHDIGELLRDRIESLCWVERYGGYLMPCPIKVKDTTFYFPVSCEMDTIECNKFYHRSKNLKQKDV